MARYIQIRDKRIITKVSGWAHRNRRSAVGEAESLIQEALQARAARAAERFDPDAPAIEDVLAEIAATVPAKEWAKLPEDLTSNLDRHIYGELKP